MRASTGVLYAHISVSIYVGMGTLCDARTLQFTPEQLQLEAQQKGYLSKAFFTLHSTRPKLQLWRSYVRLFVVVSFWFCGDCVNCCLTERYQWQRLKCQRTLCGIWVAIAVSLLSSGFWCLSRFAFNKLLQVCSYY